MPRPAKSAPPATWPENLARTRPARDDPEPMNTGARVPGTRDENEIDPTAPGYARGGKVKRTGPAIVHKGEQVVRKAAAKQYGPAKMAAVNKGTAKISARKGKH